MSTVMELGIGIRRQVNNGVIVFSDVWYIDHEILANINGILLDC